MVYPRVNPGVVYIWEWFLSVSGFGLLPPGRDSVITVKLCLVCSVQWKPFRPLVDLDECTGYTILCVSIEVVQSIEEEGVC